NLRMEKMNKVEILNALRETKDNVRDKFRTLGESIHQHVERTGILHHLNMGRDPDMIILDQVDAKLTEALIQNIYTKFDKDGDGEITMSEVSAVFNAFDADGNGDISEEEFIGSWKRAFGGSDDQALLVFGQIDKDGSKSITMDELSNLYKSMDVDGDGTITKKEFIGKWKELLR
ncbi:unnamed protein product, partial [Owenia fusiformis]